MPRSEPWYVPCGERVLAERRIPMTLDALFDGWWFVSSPWIRCEHYCYTETLRQVFAGDEYCLEQDRGPFPTREIAETFMYYDSVESYWESGMAVWASHCLECGRWAKTLAFDDKGGWAWRVTECAKCGIRDSRETC